MESSLTSLGLMFTLLKGASHLATFLLSSLFCLHLFTVPPLDSTSPRYKFFLFPKHLFTQSCKHGLTPFPTKQAAVCFLSTSPKRLPSRIITERMLSPSHLFVPFMERKTETHQKT